MLKPKKTKFKKFHKSFLKSKNSNAIFYLEKQKSERLQIESLQTHRLTAKQINAIQQAMNKAIKRKSKFDLKAFPDIAVTKKPSEVRMGKGKGSIDYWANFVVCGTVIFEAYGIHKNVIRSKLRSSITKFPFRVNVSN